VDVDVDATDGPEEPEGSEGRSPLAWASWLLVASAVVPAVVFAEVARRFLTGSADASYFGAYVSAETVRARIDFTFSVRFRLLWASVPVPEVLLASVPVVLALAAVVLAGRPGWLVPSRWGRRVAAVASLLTALESLVCLVVLFDLADEPRSDPYGNLELTYLLPNTGGFPEIAPVLALLVVTTAVPAVAALVLWRAGEARAGLVTGPGAGVVPEVTPDAEPALAPAPGPDLVVEATAVPRPSAEDLDAYRRPGG
jgi:hypothetical protein